MQTVKTTVAGICKADENLTKTDKETAGALCNYFAEVFTKENMWIHEKELKLDNVLDVVVTEDLVLKALRNWKPDKSPEPDNIHPMVLRETALEVVKPEISLSMRTPRRLEKSEHIAYP